MTHKAGLSALIPVVLAAAGLSGCSSDVDALPDPCALVDIEALDAPVLPWYTHDDIVADGALEQATCLFAYDPARYLDTEQREAPDGVRTGEPTVMAVSLARYEDAEDACGDLEWFDGETTSVPGADTAEHAAHGGQDEVGLCAGNIHMQLTYTVVADDRSRIVLAAAETAVARLADAPTAPRTDSANLRESYGLGTPCSLLTGDDLAALSPAPAGTADGEELPRGWAGYDAGPVACTWRGGSHPVDAPYSDATGTGSHRFVLTLEAIAYPQVAGRSGTEWVARDLENQRPFLEPTVTDRVADVSEFAVYWTHQGTRQGELWVAAGDVVLAMRFQAEAVGPEYVADTLTDEDLNRHLHALAATVVERITEG
ncbi:hypothetical protein LX16_4350 [Stackebrandtia albiflava]|uniref:Uncharacterized protein n=1 Tax=Stackebrandtia albiflava TaxID=406432 RepID=A0A562UR83_9ACTN|nr:hypothetical protein [Stackebrandtia albiflava]TWJ08130.1 hypothetical protein LX16_4350 [Stackebrandtia albiflava]